MKQCDCVRDGAMHFTYNKENRIHFIDRKEGVNQVQS